jgi:hypothetical protein
MKPRTAALLRLAMAIINLLLWLSFLFGHARAQYCPNGNCNVAPQQQAARQRQPRYNGQPRIVPPQRADQAPALPPNAQPPIYPEPGDPAVDAIRARATGQAPPVQQPPVQQQPAPQRPPQVAPQTLAPTVPITRPPAIAAAVAEPKSEQLHTLSLAVQGLIKKFDNLEAQKTAATCAGSAQQEEAPPPAKTLEKAWSLKASWGKALGGRTGDMLGAAFLAVGASFGIPYAARVIGAKLISKAGNRIGEKVGEKVDDDLNRRLASIEQRFARSQSPPRSTAASEPDDVSLGLLPPAGQVTRTKLQLQRVPTTDHEFEKLKDSLQRCVTYQPEAAPFVEQVFGVFRQLMGGVGQDTKKLRADGPAVASSIEGASYPWRDREPAA